MTKRVVTIFAKNNCVWCEKAKKLAENMNFEVDYRNVDSDIQYGFELVEIMPNAKTLPQIWLGSNHIGGYTEFAQEIEDTMGVYGHGKI